METIEAKKIIQEYLENLEDAIDKEKTAVKELHHSHEVFISLSLRFSSDEKMHHEHARSARDCLDCANRHAKNIEKLEQRVDALKILLLF